MCHLKLGWWVDELLLKLIIVFTVCWPFSGFFQRTMNWGFAFDPDLNPEKFMPAFLFFLDCLFIETFLTPNYLFPVFRSSYFPGPGGAYLFCKVAFGILVID